jgi:hypothetical protein
MTANFFETDDSEQLIAIACGAVTPPATPTPALPALVEEPISFVVKPSSKKTYGFVKH